MWGEVQGIFFVFLYNVIRTDPGFSGGALGRAGTPSVYGNLQANGGFMTPSLYDLGSGMLLSFIRIIQRTNISPSYQKRLWALAMDLGKR